MWDNVKLFVHVQADNIGCSSFIHHTVTHVIEGYQICQVQFAYVEAILRVINHLLFHMLSHSSQEDLCHDLPGPRGKSGRLIAFYLWP